MRVGVSTKVFLAYAVLLTAFGATSAFSVAYLHSTRQHVVAYNHLLRVQSAIESCFRQLDAFDQALKAQPKRSGAYFEHMRYSLEQAREQVDRFLEQQPSARQRREFVGYRAEITGLLGLTSEAANALVSSFQDRKEDLDRRYHGLRDALDIFRHRLEGDSVRVAEELSEKQAGATRAAITLGIAGLFGAVGAAVSLWRTIRPLRELRVRARQIASGDYDRRVGIGPQDEIGDLAREFDAMAQALQEREQRLIHSERLATVGKVAAQITHEIRNPLASIGLSAELLGDELKTDQGEAQRLLGAISGEIDRLSEITESYLRFVRLPRPVVEREDPVALVTSVMEFARAELALAGIRLELTAPASVPEIAADENQVRQALLNLIRNAREAMPSGGRLRVAIAVASDPQVALEGDHRGAGEDADGPPRRVTVSISDSGAGIPPEHAQHIFEPFFSTKASGTGLGLALVQQIVAEHGGQIAVHSPARPPFAPEADAEGQAPSPGTTFVLDFPALATTAPAAGARAMMVSGIAGRVPTPAAGLASALAAVAPPAKR